MTKYILFNASPMRIDKYYQLKGFLKCLELLNILSEIESAHVDREEDVQELFSDLPTKRAAIDMKPSQRSELIRAHIVDRKRLEEIVPYFCEIYGAGYRII
jgi:hypothetical protein